MCKAYINISQVLPHVDRLANNLHYTTKSTYNAVVQYLLLNAIIIELNSYRLHRYYLTYHLFPIKDIYKELLNISYTLPSLDSVNYRHHTDTNIHISYWYNDLIQITIGKEKDENKKVTNRAILKQDGTSIKRR